MEASNLNLEALTSLLLEEVRARGLAANSVVCHRTVCNAVLAFAESLGEDEWSDSLAERYLEQVDRSYEDPRYRLHHRRVIRLLKSLADTGEVDFSAAATRPPKYPVCEEAARAVEAALERTRELAEA